MMRAVTLFAAARPIAGLALAWLLMATPIAAAESFRGRVVGVADGDTLTVLTPQLEQRRVRLAQIDAPESRQAFGTRSKQSLSIVCFGREALVRIEDIDRYGRVVGRVTCGGVDANAHQVRSGMAWVYRRYAHDAALFRLEDMARKQRVGLWVDPEPVPPWEFRRRR